MSKRVPSGLGRSAFLVLASAALLVAAQGSTAGNSASWQFAGNDIGNSRTQPLETKLNADNVGHLAVKWTFTSHGDVSATPTVANGIVYFPDWGGYVNAVNANTGALVWQLKVSDLAGATSTARSRTSPAVYGNEVIFGDNYALPQASGAHMFAVNAQTGALLWHRQVDSNAAAVITANPVVAGGKLIVGVASNEEAAALFAEFGLPYQCCTFRGKVVALDPSSGAELWHTYTIPWNMGSATSANPDSNTPCTATSETSGDSPSGCDYSGGAVWDTPAVDVGAGRVFLGTGNNYTAPDAAAACAQAAQANNTSDANCAAAADYFDTALALDLSDGHVAWAHKAEGWDAWNVSCVVVPHPGATWCPAPSSPDYDFGGSGPNLITVNGPNGTNQKLVGLGQKSGVYWAFDETTGDMVWNTLVGPGSALGGIEWGTAYDGKRIYVPIANSYHTAYTLAGGQSATAGSWAALDPATGNFDWQVPTPDGSALAIGPASEANGVVYVGDSAGSGNNMFALDAANGKILWSFAASGSVWSAPAIANGVLYWGSGYSVVGPPGVSGNNTFYAFSLNGK
jgi:polyvinyl alcohol dehydrogenase (cytochrome)